MLYLLWVIVVFGGLFMGLGAAYRIYTSGFEASLLLMVVLYLGCAFYGLPKFLRLLTRRS